jgi:hypothetical protein
MIKLPLQDIEVINTSEVVWVAEDHTYVQREIKERRRGMEW